MEYFFNFEKMAYVMGLQDTDCILCGIAENRTNTVDLKVYCNSQFVVVVNLYPYNPGHLMIFPRKHMVDLREFSQEETLTCQNLTCRFLDVLDNLYHPSAFNIGYNMGANAGASIAHLHLHIIPRFPRELGIADLIAGKRVLVESPMHTVERITSYLQEHPL